MTIASGLDRDVDGELLRRDRAVERADQDCAADAADEGRRREGHSLKWKLFTPMTAAAKSFSRTATRARPSAVRRRLSMKDVTIRHQTSAT